MKPDVLTPTIVVIGTFAPAMFHPTWFEKAGLLGSLEVDAAVNSGKILVSPAQTSFTVSGIEINIFEERVQIATNREDLHAPVFDLASSILSLIPLTPISALGINWSSIFRAKSTNDWHNFGHRLAPKNFWEENWQKDSAGLLSLQIQLTRKDERDGSVNVSISPSDTSNISVLAKINDHYNFENSNGEQVGSFLRENWMLSRKIATDLLTPIKKDLENG